MLRRASTSARAYVISWSGSERVDSDVGFLHACPFHVVSPRFDLIPFLALSNFPANVQLRNSVFHRTLRKVLFVDL